MFDKLKKFLYYKFQLVLLFLIDLFRYGFFVFSEKKITILGSQFRNAHDYCESFLEFGLESNINNTYVIYDDIPLRTDKAINLKRGSIKHYWLALIAARYIVTHKIKDVFFVKPTTVLLFNIWHGLPIKPIGNLSKLECLWIADQLKYRGRCEYSYWDVVLCYSEAHKNIMKSVTNDLCGEYRVIGNANLNSILNKKKMLVRDEGGLIKVLYCPTFRAGACVDISSLNVLADKLKDSHSFVFKFHPLMQENIEFSGLESDMSTYDMILESDVVITDFSSLIFDVLFLKGRVISYAYDYLSYVESTGALLFDPIDIQGVTTAFNVIELEQELNNIFMREKVSGFEYQHPVKSRLKIG